MGENLFCDLCGVTVPIRTNLQMIIVGDQELAEACFNCASQLKGALSEKKINLIEAMKKPAAPEPTPMQPAETVSAPAEEIPDTPIGTFPGHVGDDDVPEE